MNILKNERGYALVITLLTITLMMPMGLFLLNVNLNSSKQFAASELYRSTIALAEMGIQYTTHRIDHQLEHLTTEDNPTMTSFLNEVNLGIYNSPEELRQALNIIIGREVVSNFNGACNRIIKI